MVGAESDAEIAEIMGRIYKVGSFSLTSVNMCYGCPPGSGWICRDT
jgi:hypothetical protein